MTVSAEGQGASSSSSLIPLDINIAPEAVIMDSGGRLSTDAFVGGDGYLAMILYDGYIKGIYASENPNAFMRHRYFDDATGMHQIYTADYTLSSSFTIDGKTVYYTTTIGKGYRGDNYTSVTPNNDVELLNYDPKFIAWTMIYGDISGGTTNTITVKWPRPTDKKALTDTFDVTVSPSAISR